jgi:FAD:protein FMN transferase
VHILSKKRFDPTVAPISIAFHEAFDQNAELTYDKSCPIGWENISLEGSYLIKAKKNISLDLCGISKGYLLDILIERLQKIGIKNALVEWAGEIRVIGKKPHRPWTVQLDDNMDPIYLYDEAVATSGSEQNFIAKTQQITHVINPIEKKPTNLVSRIRKVSVKAKTCAIADGLATAAMTFESLEEAKKWSQEISRENPDITFWFF